MTSPRRRRLLQAPVTPKPPKCPACGSSKVVPILRGLPTGEAELAARDGGAVVGGGSVMTVTEPRETDVEASCGIAGSATASVRCPATGKPARRRISPRSRRPVFSTFAGQRVRLHHETRGITGGTERAGQPADP